jgi:hypothetical protein
MRVLLDPVKLRPLTARVTFSDDNGPKGGGMHCALTVRLPYRPSLRVDQVATTARLAFDDGAAALERKLERYREVDRDRRRFPKKYYAAKNLNEQVQP